MPLPEIKHGARGRKPGLQRAGMSAAADDPALAARRVSVVDSIGYCAFLGGPPLIGFLGDHVTVRHALLGVVVLLAVATVVAGVLRPLPQPPK